eukprot:5283058-Lingulodinium_polyedra.AAC.1
MAKGIGEAMALDEMTLHAGPRREAAEPGSAAEVTRPGPRARDAERRGSLGGRDVGPQGRVR